MLMILRSNLSDPSPPLAHMEPPRGTGLSQIFGRLPGAELGVKGRLPSHAAIGQIRQSVSGQSVRSTGRVAATNGSCVCLSRATRSN